MRKTQGGKARGSTRRRGEGQHAKTHRRSRAQQHQDAARAGVGKKRSKIEGRQGRKSRTARRGKIKKARNEEKEQRAWTERLSSVLSRALNRMQTTPPLPIQAPFTLSRFISAPPRRTSVARLALFLFVYHPKTRWCAPTRAHLLISSRSLRTSASTRCTRGYLPSRMDVRAHFKLQPLKSGPRLLYLLLYRKTTPLLYSNCELRILQIMTSLLTATSSFLSTRLVGCLHAVVLLALAFFRLSFSEPFLCVIRWENAAKEKESKLLS